MRSTVTPVAGTARTIAGSETTKPLASRRANRGKDPPQTTSRLRYRRPCPGGKKSMQQASERDGWRSLAKREWISTLAILLGGVLLQSMNVLILTTILPSIVDEL